MATLTICTTCRIPERRDPPTGDPCGESLLAAVQAAAESDARIVVRGTACLMGCVHGCNVALSARDKLTYVLGGFEPGAEAAEALVGYAALYAESDTGQVPYKQWPQGVKGHFKARIPPLTAGDAD